MTEQTMVRHPAKFTESVMTALTDVILTESEALARPVTVLDPFAGIGRIHRLSDSNWVTTWGVELEPEWANQHPHTLVGDATTLPFGDETFDMIATSPCLEQSHRVLTEDLRWVPVGDVREGDRVLAFDEGRGGATGVNARRRWRRAEVTRSVPRSVECVRVILANGDEIVTTPEHSWLTYCYAAGGRRAEWVPSARLPELHAAHVQRQVEPWVERRSFDAGWLSGMFDGEGSLTLGGHGAPKMTLCQVEGSVLDRAERLMVEFGYEPNRIQRQGVPEHRQKIANLYVTGGFSGILRALGQLRPTRLLRKWEDLDITSRTVQAERVAVLAVEPAGRRDIQEIETTEGTYFGEGYLHHNCYGNRMADSYDGRDGSRRMTYRLALERELTPGSAAGMQWGPTYRSLHEDAIAEMLRVLRVGGLAAINMSNHIRGGNVQLVVEWWTRTVIEAGVQLVSVAPVSTGRYRHGANNQARVDNEHLITFRKISPYDPTLF